LPRHARAVVDPSSFVRLSCPDGLVLDAGAPMAHAGQHVN